MSTESRGHTYQFDEATERALSAWASYSESTESLVHLSHEGLSHQVSLPAVLRSSGADEDDEALRHAEHCAKYARREVESGFATLHAHALLGLWGALECLVEDLFVAALRREPALLAGEAFIKIKLPVSTLVAQDEEDRLRALLTEVGRWSGAEFAQGVTKFERILTSVGLHGPVPSAIRDAVYAAQKIRNVWAHRGGVADPKFVDACPHLGFAAGETVAMPTATFLHLMHGLHMYGFVISFRIAAVQGATLVPFECIGYEGVLDGMVKEAS